MGFQSKIKRAAIDENVNRSRLIPSKPGYTFQIVGWLLSCESTSELQFIEYDHNGYKSPISGKYDIRAGDPPWKESFDLFFIESARPGSPLGINDNLSSYTIKGDVWYREIKSCPFLYDESLAEEE